MFDGCPPVICDMGSMRHSRFDVSVVSELEEAGVSTGCLVVVEQRLDAVRPFRGGEVVEVAARVGVHGRRCRSIPVTITGQSTRCS